jgi:hypothetical protein
MAKQILEPVSRSWTTRRDEKRRRIELVKPWMKGSILPKEKIIEALETLIVSGDRIVLEGDNQKQADFLSRSLVKVDAKRLHDLHPSIPPDSSSRTRCEPEKARCVCDHIRCHSVVNLAEEET